MKRTAILIAALLLLPGIAGATQGPHGITVTATGISRILATSARLSVQIGSADRSSSLDKQKLQPIVDALVKAGADPSRVRLPLTFNAPGAGTNMASIDVTFAHPTAKSVQNGVAFAAAAIGAMRDVVLYNMQLNLIAQSCQHALALARQQAIVSARAKATSLAKDLNVEIGAAINVTSSEMTLPDGSCIAPYFINAQGGNTSGLQTAQDYVTVPATTNLTITYAIK